MTEGLGRLREVIKSSVLDHGPERLLIRNRAGTQDRIISVRVVFGPSWVVRYVGWFGPYHHLVKV